LAADISFIARETARWLQTMPGVRDLHVAPAAPRHGGLRARLPLPLPPALRGTDPSFEIRFTYKGQPRIFRYYIEQVDDVETVLNTLRVHSNGELLVRVPNEYGQLLPNEIYYGNRSATAAGLGNPAPNPPSR
jgi:hypothetical protein